MDHRLLGRSGTSVSVQTLGTMTFGKEADETAAHEILTAFVERGGNLLDTADVYTGGRSEETLGFLAEAVAAGKISYYGFSNYLGWQLTKAVHLARQHGLPAPVSLQPQYNLLVRDIEHEIVPAALDAGMGLLPWSPLAGGWLSGKYERDVPPTGATRLGENPQRGMEAWEKRNADERTWTTLEAVREVAEAHGATPSQVALAWVAAQPAVTSVIIGARTTEQLRDNMAAAELRLSEDELARLSEVSAPQMDDYPYGPAGIRQRHRGLVQETS